MAKRTNGQVHVVEPAPAQDQWRHGADGEASAGISARSKTPDHAARSRLSYETSSTSFSGSAMEPVLCGSLRHTACVNLEYEMPTYVIDQNMMEHPDLIVRLVEDPTAEFVVPDVAFVEMSKHPDWELTMGRALSPLGENAGRVSMSLSVAEAMKIESTTLRAVDRTVLLPADFRGFVQSLVEEFSRGREGSSRRQTKEKFPEARSALLELELDADYAKSKMRALVDIWQSGLKAEVFKELRKSGADTQFLLALVQLQRRVVCRYVLEAIGRTRRSGPCFQEVEADDSALLLCPYEALSAECDEGRRMAGRWSRQRVKQSARPGLRTCGVVF